MTTRTIGIDLAIRGDHVAQIYDDGRPVGRPIRFRHEPGSLDTFMARATDGVGPGGSILAVMEPTGMSWFPVAHRLADSGIAVTRVKGKRVKALRRYLSEHGPRPISRMRMCWPPFRASAGRRSTRSTSRRPGATPCSASPGSAAASRMRSPRPSAGFST